MDSYDYEQQLVGSMIIKGNHVDCIEIVGKLPAEAFANGFMREMYKAIVSLLNQCEPIDMFTVKDCVPENVKDAVLPVASSCVSSSNIKAWAKKVRQCWMIRKTKEELQVAIGILDTCNAQNINANVQQVSAILGSLRMETNDKLPRRLSEILPDWADVLERRLQGSQSGLYLQVGITPMDQKYGGFDRTDLIVVAGQPGMGKMLSNSTPILMADGGWKTHGDIKIGDNVASVDGKESLVTGVFPQGKKDIYLVEFEDGRVIESGAEHLWEVTSSRFKGSKVYDTLKIMDMISTDRFSGRIRVPSLSGDYGNGNEDDAWVIGVLLGDGGITKTTRFTNTEDYIISRMKNEVAPIKVSSKGKEHGISGCEGHKNRILSKLKQYGILGCSSKTKHIPDCFFKFEKQTRINLLCGLLETDGWVEKSGSVRFASASEKLRDGVVKLVRSLGGCATKTKKENCFYVKNGERFDASDSFQTCIKLPACVLDAIKSPRLLAHIKPSRFKDAGVGIKKITLDRQEECTCIMVNHERHLYVAGDYIVTHNTELAIMMANYIGSQRGSGLFISMEMSDIQVAERHVADRTALPIGRLKNPLGMNEEDYARVGMAIGELMEQDNYVLDETLSVDEIISHAVKMSMSDEGLGFLAVDYLGLVKKNKMERNDIAIGEITRKLKGFSLTYKVPTILLCQINREASKRPDKRPIIQDLKDSGSIEQDADVIIFPYREEVHDENTSMKGIAEIIVAKYRSGEPGKFFMGWQNGHFVNIEQEEAAKRFAKNEDTTPAKKDWRYANAKG